MKMDERDIRTLSFLVSQGKGFPMRNMHDELTFDPGLGQTGHNGSSKVAGYFNNWHNCPIMLPKDQVAGGPAKMVDWTNYLYWVYLSRLEYSIAY